MKRIVGMVTLVGLLAAPAWADIKVTAITNGAGLGQGATSQSVTYIKGNKMRMEAIVGDQVLVSIVDLDAGKVYTFEPKKRDGQILDLATVRADLNKSFGASGAKVTFRPNGRKKVVLGVPCEGYDVAISIPTRISGARELGEVTMSIGGPAWIAKSGAGFPEYVAFFKAAGAKGLFFVGPQQPKADPAQAKGLAEMYRVMASSGIPLEYELTIQVAGTGPLAGMVAKMGNSSLTTTVTSVSTDALAADVFTVPAGYQMTVR